MLNHSETKQEAKYSNKEESDIILDAPFEDCDDKERIPDNGDPKSSVVLDADESSSKHSDSEEKDPLPCPEEEEEQTMKTKYGELRPKRPPLISKDQDHAFFDSADWALGKQGEQKGKGPLQALRPKLQPSPHHQIRSRRSTYAAAADDDEGHEGSSDNCNPADEDQIRNGFSDDVHVNNQSQKI